MELPKIGERERERENCLDKKIILNSYSKKYTYSYFFNSFFFLPKLFGLCVCHILSFRIVKVPYETNNDRFKYIDFLF